MPRGGARVGAGRPKGSRTKKRSAVARKLATEGVTPLEVMIKAMHAHLDAGELDAAAVIAKDAAPYMHARLSSTQVGVSASLTLEQLVMGSIAAPIADDAVHDDGPNAESIH